MAQVKDLSTIRISEKSSAVVSIAPGYSISRKVIQQETLQIPFQIKRLFQMLK